MTLLHEFAFADIPDVNDDMVANTEMVNSTTESGELYNFVCFGWDLFCVFFYI